MSHPARRARVLAAVVLLAALAAVLAVPDRAPAYETPGPITEMLTTTTGYCRVRVAGADHTPLNIGIGGRMAECGSVLHIDGEGAWRTGNLSGYGTNSYLSLSGEATGSGTVADPQRSITQLTDTSDEATRRFVLTETNSYVHGDDAYLNAVELRNTSQATMTGRYYRRVECGVIVEENAQGSEITYEEWYAERTADGVQCRFEGPEFDSSPRLVLTPLTPGALTGGGRQEQIVEADQEGLDPPCDLCGEDLNEIDRRPYLLVAYDYRVDPGQTVTFETAFAFAPRGEDIDEIPSHAGGGAPPAADQVDRLAGPSRVETAVAISEDLFEGGDAGAVVLATADGFPDSLAGAPYATSQRAPLLLTGKDALHPATRDEIARVLGGSTGRVVILGGTAAVSDAVAAQLSGIGYTVERLAGANRFETSVRIAEATTRSQIGTWLADGGSFQGALLAGSVAAAQDDHVLLLTSGDDVPDVVREYIEANTRGTRYTVGTAAEGIGVTDADRFDTADVPGLSAELARRFYDASAVDAVAVASAENFPDALAGGAHAGALGIPLLLTPQGSAAQSILDATRDLTVSTVYLYGGTAALSDAVAAQLAEQRS